MKQRLADLADRRRGIRVKIAAQRIDVAEISQHWQKPLALADIGLKAVRFVRDHPALLAGGVAGLMALRGKGIVGLALGGWRLLYLYPSILTFALKYLPSTFRSSNSEELLAGHPEQGNANVDHLTTEEILRRKKFGRAST